MSYCLIRAIIAFSLSGVVCSFRAPLLHHGITTNLLTSSSADEYYETSYLELRNKIGQVIIYDLGEISDGANEDDDFNEDCLYSTWCPEDDRGADYSAIKDRLQKESYAATRAAEVSRSLASLMVVFSMIASLAFFFFHGTLEDMSPTMLHMDKIDDVEQFLERVMEESEYFESAPVVWPDGLLTTKVLVDVTN